MKKLFFAFIIIFQLAHATHKDSLLIAKEVPNKSMCDACSSASSGSSMGFASMLNSNFIEIKYLHQLYKSTEGFSNSPWYNEYFNTTQLLARIPVLKNLQAVALMPYHFHNKQTKTGNQSINGLGDITLIGLYNLYKTKKDSTILVHSWKAGGGIKTPTGNFNQANAGDINPSFQLGTGSWDYLLASEYIVKRKAFGLNTMLSYVYKTENEKHYRFGNQFNYSSSLFYLYENYKFTLAPQMGFAGEVYESNYQYAQKVRNTSGSIFFSKLGIELGKNKLSMGANIMLPISQNLANQRVEAHYRWSVSFNYSL